MRKLRLPRPVLAAVAVFLSACTYEAPITEKPSGGIDPALVGDWLEEGTKDRHMIVSKLNDSEYIVQYGGIFRAFPSDFEGVRFVSAQNIEPLKDSERKFALLTYELQGGKKLVIRSLNEKVIPDTLRTTREIQDAIRRNLKNPQLFNEDAGVYTKVE